MTYMRLYRYGPHTIGSRLVFPELCSAPFERPSIMFGIRRAHGRYLRATRVRIWKTDDGHVQGSLYRTTDGYLIHFNRLARFYISSDLASVWCSPFNGATIPLIRHLFLDLVMPHVLSLAGIPVLHASAIEYDGRAVVFAGETGAGKSTIAAALGRQPGRILADDCVVFSEHTNEFHASAPYPSLRLWEDSAAALEMGFGHPGHRPGKRRFASSSRVMFSTGAAPLDAICLLDRSESSECLALTRLPLRDAVVILVRHAFKFDGGERSFLEREFRFLTRLVRSVPSYRLAIPDSFDGLPLIHRLVIDAVRCDRTRRIA